MRAGRHPPSVRPFGTTRRKDGRRKGPAVIQRNFSLKGFTLQTIRPLVSRDNCVFPLTPGRAAWSAATRFAFFTGKAL